MLPRIAFCITCKGRAQHIKLTLPKNLADNATYPNAVFVILNYNSQDDLLEYLATQHIDAIASGRLVVYTHPDAPMFKMAHAKNMAHRLGILEGADILVNLDADNFTGPDFAHYIAERISESNTFLWAAMIPHVLPRGISGRIVVSKHAFLNAGGYDERFETWGRDDKDFNERLRRLGYVGREIAIDYLDAVRHNDKLRFKEYPHAAVSGPEDEIIAAPECGATIVNYGHFGCGMVFRNFGDEPIEIRPMPTRIFGIGMHKTGTTSLDEALRILGFDGAHWTSAHWAKAIWTQMRDSGRSATLERHYALTDLPLTLLYRELDAAYPGSKFILTIRDEVDWLRSVRDHWRPATNPYRHQWDNDPFTHQIHKMLYGQKGFDASVFLKRYRKHNREVMKYFADRPEDLLVLTLEDPCRWEKLCTFLQIEKPDCDYPQLNSTGAC